MITCAKHVQVIFKIGISKLITLLDKSSKHSLTQTVTSEELKHRFRELMATNQPLNEITTLFNQAVDCPELGIKEEQGNDYRLAKIIWHAMLLEMAEQCRPYSEGSNELSGKLQEYYRKKAGRVK